MRFRVLRPSAEIVVTTQRACLRVYTLLAGTDTFYGASIA